MGMFGSGAKAGSIAGFQPPEPSTLDKIGLIGDIWAGNSVTRDRLNQNFAFAQQQYQAAHPAPVNVGGSLIDPASGKVLFAPPPDTPAIAKNAAYLDQALGGGAGNRFLQNYAANGGGQGPGMITVNGQQMMRAPGGASASVPAIDPEAVARLKANPGEAAMFDQHFGAGSAARVLGTGGAAPATGPGGFPLYPAGH
jgi:hypothetical protein